MMAASPFEALSQTILHVPSKELSSQVLLTRLRSETREEHQKLEDSLDLLRPGLPLGAYTRLLSRFYGFYRPWEEVVTHFAAQVLPDFAARQCKVSNLAADLNYFGVDICGLTLCTELPACPTIAATLGGLYVTEGATLGGQLISRHVRGIFSLPEGKGDAFFRSYGEKTGSMWTSFREVLLSFSAPEADEEIIRSARQMFQAIHTWLSEGGDGHCSTAARPDNL